MDDEPTEAEIKKAMKYPRFQKIMKIILNLDKEWYFMVLTKQGVKLHSNFDLNQLKDTSSGQEPPQKRLTQIFLNKVQPHMVLYHQVILCNKILCPHKEPFNNFHLLKVLY